MTNTDEIITLLPENALLMRSPSKKDGNEDNNASSPNFSEQSKVSESEPDSEAFILCRQCNQAITTPDEQLSINGLHKHSFANPHGFIYEIGCFNSVRGCSHVGPRISEWTWFRGYSWQITVCNSCLINLGWVYESGSQHLFYGLILEHLIMPI